MDNVKCRYADMNDDLLNILLSYQSFLFHEQAVNVDCHVNGELGAHDMFLKGRRGAPLFQLAASR
jgi:hypothetical protein